MYKVLKEEGGYKVFWVESPEHEPRPIDGAKLYQHRQAAYRRCGQLNKASEEVDKMIKRDGAIIL